MEPEILLPSDLPPEPSLSGGTKSTRSHIRGSSMLLVGRLISLGLKFFLQVLIVRYLTKADYGAFAYAINFIEMGAILSLVSLDKSMSRYIPIYDENKAYASLFGALILSSIAIIAIGITLITLVFGLQGVIGDRVINDPLAVSLLLIVIALAPLQALDAWFLSLFAVFAKVRAIFFRRYILGPSFQLIAVVVVIFSQSNVYYLAWGYLIGGALGTIAYTTMFVSLFREKKMFQLFRETPIKLPAREIFGFSAPLFFSNIVFILRTQLIVVFIGFYKDTTSVASFRAVVPIARLNQIVYESFTFLYMPLAARFFARNDHDGINDLYWQTAVWISLMSFPVFILTFALAKPITVLMFGVRYQDSSAITALLALGYYFNAALGFNAHTLRVFGTLKYIVIVDASVMGIALLLNVLLIPRYGALGAAISASSTLIIHNILNHLGLYLYTPIKLFHMKYIRTYAMIVLGTLLVSLVQITLNPPLWVGMSLATAVSLMLIRANRSILKVTDTFPELLRLPLMNRILN